MIRLLKKALTATGEATFIGAVVFGAERHRSVSSRSLHSRPVAAETLPLTQDALAYRRYFRLGNVYYLARALLAR